MRPILLFLLAPMLGFPVAMNAGPLPRSKTVLPPKTAPEKRAVVRALTKELSSATADHVKVATWKLTDLDIQTSWALAGVTPSIPRDLDAITVLLHKKGGEWKVVTLGTNLRGNGQQFGVPRALWKKWGL